VDIGAIFFNLNRQNTVILAKFVIQFILLTFCVANIVYSVVKSSFFTIIIVFCSTFSSHKSCECREEAYLCRQPFLLHQQDYNDFHLAIKLENTKPFYWVCV